MGGEEGDGGKGGREDAEPEHAFQSTEGKGVLHFEDIMQLKVHNHIGTGVTRFILKLTGKLLPSCILLTYNLLNSR